MPAPCLFTPLWPIFVIGWLSALLAVHFAITPTAVLIAILVLGLPHGALDIVMINRLAQSSVKAPWRIVWLLIAYIATALLCLLTWVWNPALCLGLLLGLASYHFSFDWPNPSRLANCLLSIIVLCAPVFFQPSSLLSYFTMLGLTPLMAAQFVWGMSLVGGVSIIGLLLVGEKLSYSCSLWLFSLLFASYLLPVLYYFCLYFCALHAPLHTLQIKRDEQLAWLDLIKFSLLPFVGRLMILGIFYLNLPKALSHDALISTVFVGLFALTVPHLLLSFYYQRWQQNNATVVLYK